MNKQMQIANSNIWKISLQMRIALTDISIYSMQMQTGVWHVLEATATLAILPLWPPQR